MILKTYCVGLLDFSGPAAQHFCGILYAGDIVLRSFRVAASNGCEVACRLE
jgi:hypothetical protein